MTSVEATTPGPHDARKGTAMTVEKQARAASGWPMFFVTLVAYVASIWGVVQGIIILATAEDAGVPTPVAGPALLVGGIVLLIVAIVVTCGFFSLQPGQARVLVLFGNYVGTVRESGFYWVNPFYSHSLGSDGTGASIDVSLEEGSPSVKAAAAAKTLSTKVSLRARTLNGDRLKVNDKMGNPIEIATVVVWHVADTAKALFDVDHYPSYVAMQTETALRHVASVYAYDHMEDDDASNSSITLRSNIEEVSESLKEELDRRLAPAGVSVDDARLTHLAYAPEIAQAMLRRQQAEAIIAARKKIVEGAVSMVDMALKELSDGGVVEFDEDRKAVMASNLMVVLCGESEAQPVLNTGSLTPRSGPRSSAGPQTRCAVPTARSSGSCVTPFAVPAAFPGRARRTTSSRSRGRHDGGGTAPVAPVTPFFSPAARYVRNAACPRG